MGKKYNNLLEKIADMDNIRLAYKLAVKGGNKDCPDHLEFKEHLEVNLYEIQQEILNETYEHSAYYSFPVKDPKPRVIFALPFRDRVVQHAINNIVNPIFEKTFYPCSFACRKNKGTHKGVKAVQSTLRRLEGKLYFLKMDFSKYFSSLNSSLLIWAIKRKIKDNRVVNLMCKFINTVGVYIGNLMSQLYANIYGHLFDTFAKVKLKLKHYFRYVDDSVVISSSKNMLISTQKRLKRFIGIFLKLKFSKWQIEAVEEKSINFLGYKIRRNYKLVRSDSIVRAKRKIKLYLESGQAEKLEMFLASWYGHIKMSNSYNLKNKIKELML